MLKINRMILPLVASMFLAASGCRHAARVATAPPPSPSTTAPPAAGTPAGSFQSPSGKTYARTRVGKADGDEPLNLKPVPPGAAPDEDSYQGSARMAAKLSIAPGDPQQFTDLGALLDSLPSDESMRALDIDKGPNSGRLPQEEKVVLVKAFIYASSKESDNDFHCIVGGDPSGPRRFMNVEVSALPPEGDQFLAPLTAARNEFKTFFTNSTDALPTRGYEKYDPPIAVTITGSIFFDVDHVPPAVGPTGMKPQTAWEIHPVSDIQFEPQ